MNKFIKKTLEYIPIVLISGTVSVFAAIGYVDSKQVSYCPDTTNMEATTVSDAIDVLYANVDYVPVGSILPFMGPTAPTKYLICNGAVYNISDYPKLAEHIKTSFGSYNKFGGNGTTTFAVPDLRGEFLRGAGTASRNTGTGAALGTHQDPTQHVYSTFYTNGNGDQWIGYSKNFANPSNVDASYNTDTRYINGQASGNYASGTIPRSFTSRPTNTSVNYIIKAK